MMCLAENIDQMPKLFLQIALAVGLSNTSMDYVQCCSVALLCSKLFYLLTGSQLEVTLVLSQAA